MDAPAAPSQLGGNCFTEQASTGRSIVSAVALARVLLRGDALEVPTDEAKNGEERAQQ